jgi:hypothetical protein
MHQPPVRPCCLVCTHFRNSPACREDTFKGMITLSSGHASVRKDDGICLKHDLCLSASNWCDRFEVA